MTIRTVLHSLGLLLQEPNTKSPLNETAADLYDNNREKFNKRVK